MSNLSKILTVEQLSEQVKLIRKMKTVVQCHGVFDLLHIGHIRYIRKAKQLGEILVVTLTCDKYVKKGHHRPAFHENIRAEVLASLDFIDYVAISPWPTAVEVIQAIRPDVFCKGAEFRNKKTPELLAEEEAIQKSGGRVEFIEDITSSSSHLINRYISPFSPSVNHYLETLSNEYSSETLFAPIENASKLHPLVIGEAIVDENVFCQTLGQSSKSPILSLQYNRSERVAAGAMSVANYLAGFCDQVTLVTTIGDIGDLSDPTELKTYLKDNVTPVFLVKADSPTVIRQRFSEHYFSLPMMEVYKMNPTSLTPANNGELIGAINEMITYCDLIIVSDYGLGMMTPDAIESLSETKKFLSISTQTNAGNIGFHHISEYRRSDLVCLAERDIRLEFRSQYGDIQTMMESIASRLDAKWVIVTQGKHRCLCYHRDLGFHEAPALATKVIDRAGGNEAFHAVTTLCARQNTPTDIMAFLGQTAGAHAVSTIGVEKTLDRLTFFRNIQSLMK